MYELPVVTDLGSADAREEERARLSELVRRINDLFEGELSDADKVAYVNHLAGKMLESESSRSRLKSIRKSSSASATSTT